MKKTEKTTPKNNNTEFLKQFENVTITPKMLSNAFMIEDKCIRRHLRKHFAETHKHGDKWFLNDLSVVEYFINKYGIPNNN